MDQGNWLNVLPVQHDKQILYGCLMVTCIKIKITFHALLLK